jgi:ankyrin repeat protein
MRDTGLASVGYFYIDFRDRAKQEARGLLSTLLVQLCTQTDRFYEILSSLYVTHDRGFEQPSDDALAQCLREILEVPNQGPVFLVVDALDECPVSRGIITPRAQVLEIVKVIIELKLPHLHFCITSRPEFDIRKVLDPLKPSSVSLQDQEGQIEDIVEYVKSVVHSDETMREWPKEEKKLIIDTLARNGGGMYVMIVLVIHIAFSYGGFRFRWAFCQLEVLCRCSLQQVPSALRQLPMTLDETYERTLQGIDQKKWEFAHRIFQLLAVSARPLCVQELAEVFAISVDEETTGIPEFSARWRPQNAESAVLSACSSLIAVVNANGEKQVQFSHFSVQEFLTSNRLRDQCCTRLSQYYVLPRPAHTFFAKACLSVLLQLTPRIHKNSVKVMFPMVTYAAEHWVSHAQRGDVSSLTVDGMSRLFEDASHFAAWIWVYNMDNPSGPHLDRTHPVTPKTGALYYAALCGFLGMVKRLIDLPSEDVNSRGRDGGTPLHAAVRNGHSDVALFLLERNADPNARDNRDETPLQVVSRQGDVKAMKCLIDCRANLNAQNRDNETALSLASRDGKLEAARLLLKRGAHVDQQVSLRRTALHVASENGHNIIARLLLDKGASVHALERNLRTPLHIAADQGKEGVAQLLLQRGANVNAKEASQLTPLHVASSAGQVKTTRLLLDFKADVNAKDGEGWTALHSAAYNGYFEVGTLLLAHGATYNIKNNDGHTPLQLALENHHTEIAQILQKQANAGC